VKVPTPPSHRTVLAAAAYWLHVLVTCDPQAKARMVVMAADRGSDSPQFPIKREEKETERDERDIFGY